MTALVGILCTDGVVIGADSSGTLTVGDQRTIEQPQSKLAVLGNDIVFGWTGPAGLAQRFAYYLSLYRDNPDFSGKHHIPIAEDICKATIENLKRTFCEVGGLGVLMAFRVHTGFHLCVFPPDDFQPLFKTPQEWFVAIGSGKVLMDPFLGLLRRVFFGPMQPRLNEGIFTALWTLNLAIELNPGGIGGPPQVAVLQVGSDGKACTARRLTEDEVGKHQESIEGAETHLGNYRTCLAGGSGQSPVNAGSGESPVNAPDPNDPV
jgi:Proteasome subunit